MVQDQMAALAGRSVDTFAGNQDGQESIPTRYLRKDSNSPGMNSFTAIRIPPSPLHVESVASPRPSETPSINDSSNSAQRYVPQRLKKGISRLFVQPPINGMPDKDVESPSIRNIAVSADSPDPPSSPTLSAPRTDWSSEGSSVSMSALGCLDPEILRDAEGWAIHRLRLQCRPHRPHCWWGPRCRVPVQSRRISMIRMTTSSVDVPCGKQARGNTLHDGVGDVGTVARMAREAADTKVGATTTEADVMAMYVQTPSNTAESMKESIALVCKERALDPFFKSAVRGVEDNGGDPGKGGLDHGPLGEIALLEAQQSLKF
ncbi:hypothetical protein BC829DRAFT_54933 [Chytridium lagenaria]|nr:hypothetical protein BC829DRAFT_54933 [Chytridium lagenaria]